MLIYPDSKDLIDVLTRDNPLTPDDLKQLLEREHHELVYSWSNIIETVTFRDRNIRLTRERAEILSQLPHRFILGLPPLIRTEFRSAYQAFQANNPNAPPIDPFVNTWHRALRDPGQRNVIDLYINYGFVDQVTELVFNNPRVKLKSCV